MAINVHVCCPLMVAREGATQRISVKKTPMKNSMKNTGFFFRNSKIWTLLCVLFYSSFSIYLSLFFYSNVEEVSTFTMLQKSFFLRNRKNLLCKIWSMSQKKTNTQKWNIVYPMDNTTKNLLGLCYYLGDWP